MPGGARVAVSAHPKLMSIGLHMRMIGRPGRIAALSRIVDHMKTKDGAWFATRRQIAEHWLSVLAARS